MPDELLAKLPGRAFESISLGESGASVWRCADEFEPAVFLKAALLGADVQLDLEAQKLEWMASRALPVPRVREHGRIDDIEYLILDEAPGAPSFASQWAARLPEVVVALGKGLALLHQTDTTDCPFDCRIAAQVADARRRVAAGHVREDDFDEIRAGRSATDLVAELVASIPDSEELVFVHGDFCLPNIILQETASGNIRIAGLIDCGRAGVGDRHQDLALAARSITYNLGSEWVQPFFEAYGLAHPDPAKLHFFTLLDEFF